MWIINAIISSFLTIAGVAAAKQWVNGRGVWWSVLAMSLFTISSFIYMQTLRFERLIIVEAFWSALIIVLTVALGMVVYKERVNMWEGLAIFFAVVATLLLAIKK